jgi:hypothetical protein
MRKMSAAIQFAGPPNPENRPCTMTKLPSATIVPLPFQRRRKDLDEFEHAFPTGSDVSAMLNVLR